MRPRILIGLLVSAVWLTLGIFYLHDLWPAIAELNAHQLIALLALRTAELTFFWLVLGFIWLATGYFQQAADLRNTANVLQAMAGETAAIKSSIESARLKLESYDQERLRAAQPAWEIQSFIAHEEQQEISIRNTGAAAANIRASWSPDLPLVVALSNPNFVDRGEQLTLKIMFHDAPLENFHLTLEYSDTLREVRQAHIAVDGVAVAIRHQEC